MKFKVMETFKQTVYRFNNRDSWIIGGCAMLGFCAGFFMPQKSLMIFVACLMVGVGLGLVISSIFTKYYSDKQ